VVLRADTLEAEDAVRVGLVDDVVAHDELLDSAVALASRVGGHDAAVYAFEKGRLHRTAREAVAAVDDRDVVRAWTSPVAKDRLRAQLAKLSRGDRPGSRGLRGPALSDSSDEPQPSHGCHPAI